MRSPPDGTPRQGPAPASSAIRLKRGQALSLGTGRRHSLQLQQLLRCHWSQPRAYMLDEVALVVVLARPSVLPLALAIYTRAGEPVATLEVAADRREVRVPWTVFGDDPQEKDEAAVPGAHGDDLISEDEVTELYFEAWLVEASHQEALPGNTPPRPARVNSGKQAEQLLRLVSKLHVQLVDSGGCPLPRGPVTVTLPDGRCRNAELDGDGVLLLDGVPAGSCRIDSGIARRAAVHAVTLDHRDDAPQRLRVPERPPPAAPVAEMSAAELFAESPEA